MLFGLFGRKGKKEQQSERTMQIRKEMEAKQARYQAEFDRICESVNAVLANANKPSRCNKVTSRILGAEHFDGVTDDQWMYQEWEIWRNGDSLYLYCAEVADNPDPFKFGVYGENGAPMILKLPISEIQYFKEEGTVVSETKVSGGKVTQNRRTGRITQDPIKSKTVSSDRRFVRITAQKGGIIDHIDFERAAYDVLFALIPEKEHSRVVNVH